jgi:ABC-type polysaccharide/polyol phosphate export permease
LALLCFGTACILATLNVFYRDISHLVNVLLLPLFFLTPVFYSLDSFPRQPPEWLIMVFRYGNPVTPYIESIRATALQGEIPGWPLLVYCALVAPLLAVVGIWFLRRRDDQFAVEL